MEPICPIWTCLPGEKVGCPCCQRGGACDCTGCYFMAVVKSDVCTAMLYNSQEIRGLPAGLEDPRDSSWSSYARMVLTTYIQRTAIQMHTNVLSGVSVILSISNYKNVFIICFINKKLKWKSVVQSYFSFLSKNNDTSVRKCCLLNRLEKHEHVKHVRYQTDWLLFFSNKNII